MREKLQLRYWRHLVLAAVLLGFAAFFRFALRGYSTLALVCFAAACVVLAYYGLKHLAEKNPALSRRGNQILSYALVLFLLAFGVTEGAIVGDAHTKLPEDYPVDYVIVLGAGVNGRTPSMILTWRLERALAYLQACPEAVCIVSGGQGPGEDIPEAECMALWLKARGVSEDRILQEDQSTSTSENLRNTQALLTELEGDRELRIGLITSEFHLLRAKLTASRAGLEVYGFPARTAFLGLRVNYYIREVFGLWYYVLAGK